VRSVEPVIDRPDFSVRVVTCADDRPGWSEPEPASAAGVVLARRGMFRLRGGGHRQTVDPTMGYLQTPGEEYRYAHPAGGDVCTFIGVREPLWDVIAAEGPRPRATTR
jgi:hypothetical protein